MSYPRTIRNYNAFLDGISYFGKTSKAKLPALKIKTAAFRGAGMDAEVAQDQGMEAFQAELTFKEFLPEVIKKFGRKERLVLRPAAQGEDDFTADAWVFTLGGRLTTNEFDDLDPGNQSDMKIMMDVDYYRIEKNGEELVLIDVENGKRVIGGFDQLADIRAAMGV